MKKFEFFLLAVILLLLPAFILILFNGRDGAAHASYYDGKTIKIIEGRTPGGTGTLRTVATVKHLKKYLGNSTAVFQYMPGGGGKGAANYISGSARRDGLTIGNSSSGILSGFILGARGVRYNLDDLVILGAGSSGGTTTMSVRPALKIDSVEKLKAYKGLRFAQRSVGHAMYIRDRLTAYILGLQEPRWILGYSDREIRMALQTGEADASFGGIAGLMRESSQWIQEGFTFPIHIRDVKGTGPEAYPGFPQGTPSVDQFTDTKLKKALLQMFYATTPGGSIFYVHKDIPKDALEELKSAFDKVWADPEFAKEYEAMTRQAADPMTGQHYMDLIRDRPKDPEVLKVFKELTGGGPLPPRK